MVHRFDRSAGLRVGFASALTLLEATDGEQRSDPEIADVIERHSPTATADLRELYGRIVFSILTGNTDDHLRNHAFLRQGRGWTLSPAFDLNPNPDRPDRLSTAIDLDDTTADIATALSVSGYFRLSLAEARSAIASICNATTSWRSERQPSTCPPRKSTGWRRHSRRNNGEPQATLSPSPASGSAQCQQWSARRADLSHASASCP